MVQAETIVHFYYDLESEDDYNNKISHYLSGLKGTLQTEETISIGTPFENGNGLSVRVVAKLKVSMDERPSCKHLDDYVSFIFPTVKRNILGELISTQNLYLTYARKPKPVKKKVNWEELYQHWND
ncbi:hypothetical protein [Evansella cellulosilytica]|uniref:Uncharacterized protein n=1 Tax=Evansella cellulosilytica (strain ATCC 21833 / DSM 2522 / FERM P-1141 / JCM 9156 / N-4) TaxID=649639 RepID=E6TSQ7_EVAC2|nr:hypothetical protein [Evansella cellulosilytica]ADU29565.1 hypothetical protein Bcell_1300 [Evansella cellulosilytica DSM 2522]